MIEYQQAKYETLKKNLVLPPGLEVLCSYEMGVLKVVLGRIYIKSANYKCESIFCKYKFWGERIFNIMRPSSSQTDHQTQLAYSIRCSMWHFHKYLERCKTLSLLIFQKEREIGKAEISFERYLAKQLVLGVQPMIEINQELQVLNSQGKSIGSFEVNIHTKFNHTLHQEIYHLLDQVIEQRKANWTKLIGIARCLDREQSTEQKKGPEVNEVDEVQRLYDCKKYIQKSSVQQQIQVQVKTQDPIVSVQSKQGFNQYLTKNNRLSSTILAINQTYQRKARTSNHSSHPVLIALKLLDLRLFEQHCKTGMEGMTFKIQVQALNVSLQDRIGSVSGDYFIVDRKIQFQISQSESSVQNQLRIRFFINQIQLGRTVLGLSKLREIASGIYCFKLLNRIPLQLLVNNYQKVSKQSKLVTESLLKKEFQAKEIGELRLEVNSKKKAERSRCLTQGPRRLFQCVVFIKRLNSLIENEYLCKYKIVQNNQYISTESKYGRIVNFNHKSIFPVSSDFLQRLVRLPLIIEVWRKTGFNQQVEGLVKISLEKAEKALNQYESVEAEEDAIVLCDQVFQLKSLANLRRGSLQINIAFGLPHQIQSFLNDDFQQQARHKLIKSAKLQLCPLKFQKVQNRTLTYQAPHPTTHNAPHTPTYNAPRPPTNNAPHPPIYNIPHLPTNNVDPSFLSAYDSKLATTYPFPQGAESNKERQVVRERGDESECWTCSQKNQFLQNEYSQQLSQESSLNQFPPPLEISYIQNRISYSTKLLNDINQTIRELLDCCHNIKQQVSSRLKDTVRFGFIQSRIIKSHLQNFVQNHLLIQKIMLIIDPNAMGMSFIITLWDYIKSYQIYGEVINTFIDSTAFSKSIFLLFRKQLKDMLPKLTSSGNKIQSRMELWREVNKEGTYVMTEQQFEGALYKLLQGKPFTSLKQLQKIL